LDCITGRIGIWISLTPVFTMVAVSVGT